MNLTDRYHFLLALLSAHNQDVPWTGALVGCTLSYLGNPLYSFSNLITEYKRPSLVHAEIRCLIKAIQDSILLDNCCLYITAVPCEDCYSVIATYGIKAKFLLNWRGKLTPVQYKKDFVEGCDATIVLKDLQSCLPNSPLLKQYWTHGTRRLKKHDTIDGH